MFTPHEKEKKEFEVCIIEGSEEEPINSIPPLRCF